MKRDLGNNLALVAAQQKSEAELSNTKKRTETLEQEMKERDAIEQIIYEGEMEFSKVCFVSERPVSTRCTWWSLTDIGRERCRVEVGILHPLVIGIFRFVLCAHRSGTGRYDTAVEGGGGSVLLA